MQGVSREVETIIRYDGPALVGHEMDVDTLAPALLALAELIQIANKEFNGADAIPLRIVVNADVEQKCFQIKLKFVQTIIEAAKGFLDDERVVLLKTLLEWVGLGAGTGLSFLKILKLVGEKKPPAGISFVNNGIVINLNGQGGEGSIPPEVARLLQNPAAIEKGKRIAAPLARDGYETFEAFAVDGSRTVSINKREAEGILALPAPTSGEQRVEGDDVHTQIRGRASIITRRDEGKAQWGLKWTGRVAPVNMPDDWLAEYQAGRIDIPVGSWLDVTIEMTTSRTDPNAQPTYKVVAVHEVFPPGPTQQSGMFDDNPS